MAVSIPATTEESALPGGAAAPSRMGTTAMRVAVLDRDSGFIQVLSKRLERIGTEHRILSGPVPVEAVAAMRLSALVVDLVVLGPQAWEWLERLCSSLPELGVVVCTAPSTVAQRVRGLRLGADDWITKPTHPEEVIARVESVARRRRRTSEKAPAKPTLAGEVEVRPDHFQAFVSGRSLDLTRREYELIQLLAGAEGRVMEREEIYSRLWGYAMVRGDRSVDVFVRKVRQKLEKASPGWRYIHTHFGIGYRFAAEPMEQDMAAERSPAERSPGERSPAERSPGALPGRRRPQEVSPEPGSDAADRLAGDHRELARAQQEDELAGAAV